MLRDFADAAETYPDAHWPAQAQRTLRGLICAWRTARDEGLPEIPESLRDPLIEEFGQAIRVRLVQLPGGGPRHSTAQHPGRDLLEFCRETPLATPTEHTSPTSHHHKPLWLRHIREVRHVNADRSRTPVWRGRVWVHPCQR